MFLQRWPAGLPVLASFAAVAAAMGCGAGEVAIDDSNGSRGELLFDLPINGRSYAAGTRALLRVQDGEEQLPGPRAVLATRLELEELRESRCDGCTILGHRILDGGVLELELRLDAPNGATIELEVVRENGDLRGDELALPVDPADTIDVVCEPERRTGCDIGRAVFAEGALVFFVRLRDAEGAVLEGLPEVSVTGDAVELFPNEPPTRRSAQRVAVRTSTPGQATVRVRAADATLKVPIEVATEDDVVGARLARLGDDGRDLVPLESPFRCSFDAAVSALFPFVPCRVGVDHFVHLELSLAAGRTALGGGGRARTRDPSAVDVHTSPQHVAPELRDATASLADRGFLSLRERSGLDDHPGRDRGTHVLLGRHRRARTMTHPEQSRSTPAVQDPLQRGAHSSALTVKLCLRSGLVQRLKAIRTPRTAERRPPSAR